MRWTVGAQRPVEWRSGRAAAVTIAVPDQQVKPLTNVKAWHDVAMATASSGRGGASRR